jgi:hypothetical protein
LSLPPRKFLKGLLESEEGQQRIKTIWDEATTPGRKKMGWFSCHHCKKRNEVEVEAYSMREVTSLMSLFATFGVGKPPEEKKVDIQVTARRIQDATDEELFAIVEGRAGELGTGSE